MAKMKKEDIIMVLLLLAAALCCSCSGNDENRLQESDIVLNISDADVKGMTAREVHGRMYYFLIVKDYAGSPAGKCEKDTTVMQFVATPKEYDVERGVWKDIYDK